MVRRVALETLAAGCESALVGGLIGLLIAAFRSVIGGTTAGMVVAPAGRHGPGSSRGRMAGAFCGAWCGVIFIGFAMAVGGSATGMVVATMLCGLIAVWFDWLVSRNARRKEADSTEATFRPTARAAFAEVP